jgi:hypothetical protein
MAIIRTYIQGVAKVAGLAREWSGYRWERVQFVVIVVVDAVRNVVAGMRVVTVSRICLGRAAVVCPCATAVRARPLRCSASWSGRLLRDLWVLQTAKAIQFLQPTVKNNARQRKGASSGGKPACRSASASGSAKCKGFSDGRRRGSSSSAVAKPACRTDGTWHARCACTPSSTAI